MKVILIGILIVFLLSFILAIILSWLIGSRIDYENFNRGVCPKCGKPLVLSRYSSLLDDIRCYHCSECEYVALVSRRWVDKKYKHKNDVK